MSRVIHKLINSESSERWQATSDRVKPKCVVTVDKKRVKEHSTSKCELLWEHLKTKTVLCPRCFNQKSIESGNIIFSKNKLAY